MRILLLAVMVLVLSCEDDRTFKNDGCVDESKITLASCYEIYSPVCGCNGETYSNDCEAKAAGVLQWTTGVCAK